MSIILMRHAESNHNLFKNKIKSKITQGSVKKTCEYLALRHSSLMRDDLLTPSGCSEADLVGSTIDWANIELVLTSPMRRCLETCRRVLSKAQKNLEVKVLPILKGRLSGAWDFGSSISELQNSFSQFNFMHLTQENQLPWYIRIMQLKKQMIYKKHYQFENKLYQILEEDRQEFEARVDQLREVIQAESKKLQSNKKILVITHSCVLKTLMAQQTDEKGKKKSSYKFKNAKPIQFHPSQVFYKKNQFKKVKQMAQDTSNEF